MRLGLIVRGQHPAGDEFDHEFAGLLVDHFLIGSVAEVADRPIAPRRGLGVSHLFASVHRPGRPNNMAFEQMQILAEEVMPAARRD